ncbi:MAG: RagB/SusD family nutrient uptake outer membrane protein [Capnocytophaga sp.]|nr:RagB/SusD family nutrient uptake outer membrane protein [Capnocytophaga sp.]
MKNLYKKIIAVLLPLFAAGCHDLDQTPFNSMETGQSFETISDADYWANGMYLRMRNRTYGQFMYATDIQGDLLNATIEFGNTGGDLHRWDPMQTTQGSAATVWSGFYKSIANINIALSGLKTIVPQDDAEKERLNQRLGELHLGRAYAYSRLVLRFSKPYNKATATTDLGMPLVYAFDINEYPKRSTMEETYTQILSDITEAEALLKNKAGSAGASTFTIDAVTALKARTYLYMQNWDEAYKAANTLIASGTYPLAASQAELKDIWHVDNTKESIMMLFASAPDELGTANTIYLAYRPANGYFYPQYIPTQWIMDQYDNADYRKSVYFEEKRLAMQGRAYRGYVVNKYPGNPALFTTANTNYQHFPKVFRIAEMYLIAAEAAYHSGDDALTPLNALRTARGTASVSATGTALLEEIKNERMREMAFEGSRLDDLKRWGDNITRRTPQLMTIIMSNPANQFHELDRPATAHQTVWPVPYYEININPNIAPQQNEGW